MLRSWSVGKSLHADSLRLQKAVLSTKPTKLSFQELMSEPLFDLLRHLPRSCRGCIWSSQGRSYLVVWYLILYSPSTSLSTCTFWILWPHGSLSNLYLAVFLLHRSLKLSRWCIISFIKLLCCPFIVSRTRDFCKFLVELPSWSYRTC